MSTSTSSGISGGYFGGQGVTADDGTQGVSAAGAVSHSTRRSGPSDPNLTGADVERARLEPQPRRRRTSGRLDRRLLSRAGEILENIEGLEEAEMALAIESLRCILCELWNTAASATSQHQSILAIAESMVNAVDSISLAQAAALRGAIVDLERDNLTETHVEVTRSRFIEEGYNPLAILSETSPADGGGEHGTDQTKQPISEVSPR